MYDKDNDISRIFITDSREKKRVAVGIHNRASRRGYIRGGIRTASDYLTAKQKRELNGEVKVYSMYDVYADLSKCNLDEILKKEDKEIKGILTVIKKENSCNKICSHFKISNGRLYTLYKKYGVHFERKPRTNVKGLEDTVIPKSKFDLMDGLDKGRYIVEVNENFNLTINQLSVFWGIPTSNLKYHKKRYVDQLKRSGKVASQVAPVVTKKDQQIEEIAVKTIQEIEPNREEELTLHIAELEAELNRLRNNIITNVADQRRGLSLNINGEYSKEELGYRLLSIDEITVQGKTYKINLILEEV